MDGLKAEPARSLPPPRNKGQRIGKGTREMATRKPRDKRLFVAYNMPPLRKTQPGQEYDHKQDEVLKWISERPGLLMYVFDKLVQGKYIEYDSDTGTWQGVDYDG